MRQYVARSASRLWKLCTGRPSSVRPVVSLRRAAGERCALATTLLRSLAAASRSRAPRRLARQQPRLLPPARDGGAGFRDRPPYRRAALIGGQRRCGSALPAGRDQAHQLPVGVDLPSNPRLGPIWVKSGTEIETGASLTLLQPTHAPRAGKSVHAAGATAKLRWPSVRSLYPPPCSLGKPTRFPGRQKPSQFRSVSGAQRGLRTEFRPLSHALRPKSPASLSPQNSELQIRRVRRGASSPSVGRIRKRSRQLRSHSGRQPLP